jgi:hypothetical protein
MAELKLTFPELPAFDGGAEQSDTYRIADDSGGQSEVPLLRNAASPVPGWPTQPVTMVIPDTVLSSNVVSEARRGKKKLPPQMVDLLDRFDWHRVPIKIGIRPYPEPRGGVQGARDFGLRTRVVGGLSRDGSAVEDVGPASEWLPKSYKFEAKAKLKVTTAAIAGAVQFVGGPKLPLPDASVDSTFTYVWQPQVQAVSSNLAENGHGAEWTFKRSRNRWLDGQNYDLVLMIRRDRTVETMTLEVEAGWVDWSVRLSPGATTTLSATGGGMLRIPIVFAESRRPSQRAKSAAESSEGAEKSEEGAEKTGRGADKSKGDLKKGSGRARKSGGGAEKTSGTPTKGSGRTEKASRGARKSSGRAKG